MFIKILFFIILILISILALVIGNIFASTPPKPYNPPLGYKTSRAKKSERAWDLAHQFSGKLLILFGNIFLFITAVIYIILVFYLDVKYFLPLVVILFISNLLPYILTLFITEIKLAKFNKNISNEEKLDGE